MNEELIQVIQTEVHHWPSCACGVCEQERQRRCAPANTPIRKLRPEQAQVLGYRKAARHGVDEQGRMSDEPESVSELAYAGRSVAGRLRDGTST